MINSPLTAERLREVLRYEPETGDFFWRVSGKGIKLGARAGRTPSAPNRYVMIKIDQRAYLAHRLAWLHVFGRWPKDEMDHKNGDGFDNRIENLRECNRWQNNGNRRVKANKKYSALKGVSFFKKQKKWSASIRIGGRSVHLGLFQSDSEAHLAYVLAASKHFGEFSRAA